MSCDIGGKLSPGVVFFWHPPLQSSCRLQLVGLQCSSSQRPVRDVWDPNHDFRPPCPLRSCWVLSLLCATLLGVLILIQPLPAPFRATGHLRMPFCDLLVSGRTVARLLSQALFPWICLAAISSLCRGYFYEACLTLDFILVAKCRSFLQLGFSTCLGFHKCLCPVRDPELDRRRGELWRAEPFLGIRLPPPVLLPKTSLLIAPTLIHTGCEYIAGVGRQGLTHSLSSL